MKKLIVFLLCFVLLLSLAVTFSGCKKSGLNEMLSDFITESEEDEPESQEPSAQTDDPSETAPADSAADGLSADFKKAMDSYEQSIEEYVAFLKKYNASNGTDLSLISEYTKYMTKYAEMMSDFGKWQSNDMNAAESAYYLQVQSRVNQKLLEVTQ